MTIRNLDALFRPSAVAVVGAGGALGTLVTRNLLAGGLDGPVMPVQPGHSSVASTVAFPDLTSLPITPDLAIVCAAIRPIPEIVFELGRRGTRAIVVMCRDERPSQEMLDAAQANTVRLLGPDSLGIATPRHGLNASALPLRPRHGPLALVAQSGAMTSAIVEWAETRDLGFALLASLGETADVDFGDILDYLAGEPDAATVMLHVETVTHARKFLSAARALSRLKPVVVLKTGRYSGPPGTPHDPMTGSDAAFDAAVRRAGMVRVRTIDEMFEMVETFAHRTNPRGDRIAILTDSTGTGSAATDTLIDEGGSLATLSPDTIHELSPLSDGVEPTNPMRIGSDTVSEAYGRALKALLADNAVDAVVVLNCPSAVVDRDAIVRALIENAAGRERRLLASFTGGSAARECRRRLAASGIASFATPDQAVRACMQLVRYRRGQDELMEAPTLLPPSPDNARGVARSVIESALAEGRHVLSLSEALSVISAYGIPTIETRFAETPEDTARLAEQIGLPVALKALSPDTKRKTDYGGVALDVDSLDAVAETAEAMAARMRSRLPGARLSGFAVQPMVRKQQSLELDMGASVDPVFGPVLHFGEGGTEVDLIGDRATALPPLNAALARSLVDATRVARRLSGLAERPPVNRNELETALVRLSDLVADLPEIRELDINPLLIDDVRVLALDTRIHLFPPPAVSALAIRPYPRELERSLTLAAGRTVRLRAIRPEDEPALTAFFGRMSPSDLRLRFFTAIHRLQRAFIARLTQIDYDREMALVALDDTVPVDESLLAVVRLIADPDGERAEYSIMVRSDLKGQGLGFSLMSAILDYARSRGIMEVFGEVLRENVTMLRMCRELGFQVTSPPDEPGIAQVTLPMDRWRGEVATMA